MNSRIQIFTFQYQIYIKEEIIIRWGSCFILTNDFIKYAMLISDCLILLSISIAPYTIRKMLSTTTRPQFKRIAFVLFPGYELLDVFGPMEFFSAAERVISGVQPGTEGGYVIDVISVPKGPVEANTGPVCAFGSTDIDGYLRSLQGRKIDIGLIPGGGGARQLVNDMAFLQSIQRFCDSCETVATVCTGSALLAKAGILDGRQATSNKMSYGWVISQSDKVKWQPKARWVVDGRYWTSSGVAAGMDMSLALIERDFGVDIADKLAKRLEYIWNKDSTLDPFEAKL